MIEIDNSGFKTVLVIGYWLSVFIFVFCCYRYMMHDICTIVYLPSSRSVHVEAIAAISLIRSEIFDTQRILQ
jgi:hypothetical protein